MTLAAWLVRQVEGLVAFSIDRYRTVREVVRFHLIDSEFCDHCCTRIKNSRRDPWSRESFFSRKVSLHFSSLLCSR
jgi:hypothetical protein